MMRKNIILIFPSFILYLGCISQTKDTSVNFYFEFNSAKLDSNQYRRLNDFSSTFQIKSIRGYADTTGTKKCNLSLSQKRALAVYTALKSSTDSIKKINLLYYGESVEEPELWENRRVEVIARPITESKAINQIPASEATHQVPVNALASDTTVRRLVIVRDFNLDHVYFMPDLAVITPESQSYMHELAETLKNYKTESFEIIGHINYQSRFDSTHLGDLFTLSKRRAKAVYDFLVEQGLPASRMSYKGVGNSQPIYPSPKNDEERRKNMRVQIIIKR